MSKYLPKQQPGLSGYFLQKYGVAKLQYKPNKLLKIVAELSLDIMKTLKGIN